MGLISNLTSLEYERVLEDIRGYRDDFTENAAITSIPVFYNHADKLDNRVDIYPLNPSPEKKLRIIIAILFEKIQEENRGEVTKSIASKINSLSWKLSFIEVFYNRKSQKARLVSEDFARRMFSDLLDEVAKTEPEVLFKERRYMRMLYLFSDSQEDKQKKWLVDFLSDDRVISKSIALLMENWLVDFVSDDPRYK